MINIYSIEEIINASNKILESNKSIPKETEIIIKEEEDILNLKKERLTENAVIQNTEEPLILKNEIIIKKKILVKKVSINQNELENNLFVAFKGKLKKNTIKLIIELKKNIDELNNKIIKYKYNTIESNEVNKLLKDDILNLVNIERNLKYNLKKNEIVINKLKEEHQDQNLKWLKTNETHEGEIKYLRKNNKDLEDELNLLKSKINNETENLTKTRKFKDKTIHYQEENLRISNELIETRRKLEIFKGEMNNYKSQKINLIDKLSSINELMGDTNLLTNVFDNKKIKIQNVPNPNLINNQELDKEIEKIFFKE